jgi:hypothetical protein
MTHGAMGDREGGEDATATATGGGRRTRRGGGDAVVGGVVLAVEDNGEDVGVAASGTKQQPTP